MQRTTMAELDALARIASRQDGQTYSIEYAYGSPRMTRANGSVDVSPRLPAGQLASWIRAYISGQDSIRSAARRLAETQAFLRGDPIGSPDRPAYIGGVPFVAREDDAS